MLSRSTFNIRKLISQKKPREDGDEDFVVFEIEDDVGGLQSAHKEPRSQTWTNRKHLTSLPPTKSKTDLGFANHFRSRTPSPMPPLADGTPHSSSSSLCSCEYHVDLPSSRPLTPGSRSPALCPPRVHKDDARSTTSARPAAQSPSPCLSSKDTMASNAQSLALDLPGALSDCPTRMPPTPPNPPKRSLDNNSVESWSSDMQQLIHETDKAFQAVSSALAEAKLASQSFAESAMPTSSKTTTTTPPPSSSSSPPPPSSSSPPPQAPFARQHTITRRPLPPQAPAFPKRTTSLRGPHPVPLLTTPTSAQPTILLPTGGRSKRRRGLRRNKSKSKRKIPSPVNSQPKRKTLLSVPSSGKHNLRWTLTDNVSDLFSAAGSKLFSSRIEADEMLTPSQIQELKLIRLARLNKSNENTASCNAETKPTTASSTTTGESRTQTDTTAQTHKASDSAPDTSASATAMSVSTTTASDSAPDTSASATAMSVSTTASDSAPNASAPAPATTISEATSTRSTWSCDSQRPTSITSIYSVDSVGSGAETPVDAFHLSDLPSRIRASDVPLLAPSPLGPLPAKPFGSDHQVLGKTSDEDHTCEGTLKTENENCMALEAIAFPSPPLKNPARYLPRKNIHLPVIAEVGDMATTPMADPAVTAKNIEPAQQKPMRKEFSAVTEDSESLFLQSTPYSINALGFRHGPIKFNKAELKRNLQLRAISNRSSLLANGPTFAEDTLDWTAFQMAILGGAGDVFWNTKTEVEDEEELQERKELEELEQEILDFWEDIGCGQTEGRLITETDETEIKRKKKYRRLYSPKDEEDCSPNPRQDSPKQGESSPASLCEPPEVNQEPEMQERGHSFLPIMPETLSFGLGKQNAGVFDPEKYYAGASVGLTRWLGEGHPKRYTPLGGERYNGRPRNNRKMNRDTMPLSPMMEIRVTEGENGQSTVGVPMGYNISHDLGDFLKWEAQHVYAGGYYGPN